MVKTVKITYIEPSGEEKEVDTEIGKNLLDIAHENNIELEGMIVFAIDCWRQGVSQVCMVLIKIKSFYLYRCLWRRIGMRDLSLDF